MGYSPGEMIALAVIFSILPLIAVGLRMWARRIMKARYCLDDYFIFVALVITITSGFTIVYDAIYGENGRHQDLGPHGEPIMTSRLVVHGKVRYASQLLDLLSFASAKLSVLFLYRRIFALPTFTLLTTCLITLVSAWFLAFFFTLALQCAPISVLWTSLFPTNCINIQPVAYTNSVTDFVFDLFILAMPLPLLLNLKLDWRKKCAVGGMFALGGVDDVTYYESPFSYWSQIEASLGVVSACLPVLRPVFVRPKFPALGLDGQGAGYGGRGAFGDRSDLKDDALQHPFGDRSDLKDDALRDPFADVHEVGGVGEEGWVEGMGNGKGTEKKTRLGTEKELPQLPECAHHHRGVGGRFGEGAMV
ncbi:MAG: hypothetical protein Q9195_007167 [Heterodermia aff. obscurata]